MSEEHKDDSEDRGALVLSPKAPADGTFSLLVPGDTHWEVSYFHGAIRLDFRPRSREERARQIRDEGER
jgi:hypothetical protein